jgi:hypothetical protein
VGKDRSYRINTPGVVLEFFDDEVILVNLDQGAYYSTQGLGCRVVALLNEGARVSDLLRILPVEFEAVPESIAASIEEFLDRLDAEGLVVKSAREGTFDGVARQGAARPFQDPVLQKYTDLRDLLLLDPIHDVDDAGWPVRKPQGE